MRNLLTTRPDNVPFEDVNQATYLHRFFTTIFEDLFAINEDIGPLDAEGEILTHDGTDA